MNKQEQLQELASAVSALEGSKARERLQAFFDEGSFIEIDRLARDADMPVGVIAGYGLVDGCQVYAYAQDRDVCYGAIGKAQAAKILRIYQLASQNGVPVVGVFDSDGARLGEGIDAMDAIADILAASNTLSGVVPQIAVIAGACVGSSAVIAANADVLVASKQADYYLNANDDNAVSQADIVADDADKALETARRLITMLPANNLSVAVAYDDFNTTMANCETVSEVIDAVADADSVIRLYLDGCETALARVGGTVCGLMTMAGNEISCRSAAKLARFVRLCDAFSLPLITFVDAAGFAGIKGAAKLSHAVAEATTVKITVIIGKAYGTAYIAAAGKSAGADMVLAWPSAVILPLAPEAAIHIFWKDRLQSMTNPAEDRARLAEKYAQQEGSALKAAAHGDVTDVIAPQQTKEKLVALLDMLSGKRVSRLPKKHSNILL